MWRRKKRRDMADVNVYTAKRLNDMAQSLEILAKSCVDTMEEERSLTKDDALAAMQMSAAMVCGECSRCNLYSGDERDDSYYLYYLLRAFEQKGHVDYEDMPRLFLETCRRREEYVGHLNRNLGRATMNLEWKNRFLESRDTVMVQFRELAVILEEFAHQMELATDVTELREHAVKRLFAVHHMEIENMLVLEYDNGHKEAYLTARTTNGKCITVKEASVLFGQALGDQEWSAPKDTRALITRQAATIRLVEKSNYQMHYGVAHVSKEVDGISGDSYTYSCNIPGQVVMSLSDGMGSGEPAAKESRRVVELTQQLIETGFSSKAALKMVNTILLLTGAEQHPATLDLCCVDLQTGVLEAMKLGAVPTFVLGEGGVDLLEAGAVPAGILNPVEPLLLSRKLWDGDRIVMVSDGILDACPGVDKELSLKEYIEGMTLKTPQDMAERILRFACQNISTPRDDMMVLTAAIWKRR